MKRVKSWLEGASTVTVLVLAIALVFALGLVDYLTGPQLAFTVFYLFPIAVAEWRLGLWKATIVAVVAANTWLVADLASDQPYDHAWIPVWNTTTRLGMFLIVVKLLNDLRAALNRQTHLARLDPLTGLLNARAFHAVSKDAIEDSRSRGLPFTFAFLDLDDFKAINDRIGHTAGDETLRIVGEQMRAHLRSTDIIGRLGGDEFAIMLPATGSDAAKTVMATLLDRLRAGVSKIPAEVTFSAGAATYLVAPENVDEVIKESDQLMYQAKREGKNRHIMKVVGEEAPDAVTDLTPPRDRRPESMLQTLF